MLKLPQLNEMDIVIAFIVSAEFYFERIRNKNHILIDLFMKIRKIWKMNRAIKKSSIPFKTMQF